MIVSTDDLDIIRMLGGCEGVEVPFVRPAYLSEDQSIVTDAIFHAMIGWRKMGLKSQLRLITSPLVFLRY